MTNFNVIYEDNHILVINKKANVLVQKDNTNDIDLVTDIKAYLKDKYNKPGNVYLGLLHRLDRPVGGLMVFAKTSKAAERLSKSIQARDFKKSYLAVTKGNIKSKDTLINYIGRKDKLAYITNSEKDGKYAELSYEVIDKVDDLNLVQVLLKTGRHHQIRIQFANTGHPLYGDQLYGLQNKEQIALFAYRLEFTHPVTKELMVFKKLPIGGVWDKFNYGRVL